MRRIVLRALGLVVALLLVASVLLFVWAPFATDHPPRADAIAVLAGSRTRLPVALRLWHRRVAPTIVVSEDPKERRRAAFCTRPPAGAICFRARPYSTRGEAREVARLASVHRWRSLVVVTSRFHLFRTRLLFRRCTRARLELVAAPVAWWQWFVEVPAEWAKLAVALTTERAC